jgi:hypothetical protein
MRPAAASAGAGARSRHSVECWTTRRRSRPLTDQTPSAPGLESPPTLGAEPHRLRAPDGAGLRRAIPTLPGRIDRLRRVHGDSKMKLTVNTR